MKVFIGWSGQTSKEVASILKVWLPQMNPHIETFMSSEDVRLEVSWKAEIMNKMRETDYALLCVTRENLNSPWLCFETGVFMGGNVPRVNAILFDVSPSQVSGPLQMFPLIEADKINLRLMVYSLNQLCETQCPIDELKRIFDGVYPTVEKMFAQVRESQKDALPADARDAQDLKREIVAVNSKLDAILSRLGDAV